MPEIIENIHPTRMELLEMNKRIKLATKGHKLLKQKRDSLVVEFFKMIDDAKKIQGDLEEAMNKGYGDLIRAEALMGLNEIESVANGIPAMPDITLEYANVMGVQIPRIELETNERKPGAEYGFMLVSSKLDDAVDNFGIILEEIIKLVEKEEGIRRLSEEIKRTRRRVNALEYVLIPKLSNTQKYIRMRLEELERENFFRLKTVKKKMRAE